MSRAGGLVAEAGAVAATGTTGSGEDSAPRWLWPWAIFLFLVPFEAILNVADLATPLHALGVGAALVLALSRPGRVATLPALGVSFLVMALAVSYFLSVDPAQTRSALATTGIAWLTYILATAVALHRTHALAAGRAWMWGGAASALYGLASFAQGRVDVDGRLVPVLSPSEGDPNFFVTGFVFPMAIALHLLGRKHRRLEAAVCMMPMLAAAALAQSRGGFVALAATLVVLLVAERRWKSLLLAAALVPALYLGFQPNLGRMDVTQDLSGSRRTEIWPVGLEQGARNWATGTGLATFPRLTESAKGLYWARDAHSTLLQAYTEAGIPALLALLLVFVTHFRIQRGRPLAAPIVAGLAGTAAAGVFLHMVTFDMLWAGWIVAAQAARAER